MSQDKYAIVRKEGEEKPFVVLFGEYFLNAFATEEEATEYVRKQRRRDWTISTVRGKLLESAEELRRQGLTHSEFMDGLDAFRYDLIEWYEKEAAEKRAAKGSINPLQTLRQRMDSHD